MERLLRVNLLGPGPRFMKKRIYWAAVSQRLRNTAIEDICAVKKLSEIKDEAAAKLSFL